MRKIRALGLLIALAAWQGRGLVSGVFLGLIAGGGARFFATASLGQEIRLIHDLLLAITVLGSLVIAWSQANALAHLEHDRGVGLMLASKPLSAWQYAVGRGLGLALGILPIFFLSSVVGLLIATWGIKLSLAELLLAWLVSLGELLVLTALANLMACWTTPTLAGLLTLPGWFIGHSLDLLAATGAAAGGLIGRATTWLPYILPNFNHFNLHETYLNAAALPVSYYVLIALYAAGWIIILTLLATAAVKRREW